MKERDEIPLEVYDIYNLNPFEMSSELRDFYQELVEQGVSSSFLDSLIHTLWHNTKWREDRQKIIREKKGKAWGIHQREIYAQISKYKDALITVKPFHKSLCRVTL